MATLPHRWSKTRLAGWMRWHPRKSRVCFIQQLLEKRRGGGDLRNAGSKRSLGSRPQAIFLQAELIISFDQTIEALFCKFNYVISFEAI
jgi:hypothetical protein